MASTADKDKNRLDTGTLGWKDIDNKADFTAEHTGGSIGTGGPIGSQLITNAAGGLLSNANNSGHAEGTTQSAVSDGTVIVRNEDKQKQDVNELNRDTEHANDGSINPIFDKEKEQNRLKQSQLIGEIGNQTMDIIRTEGEIAGLKAQKDPDALAIAKKQLESEGKTLTDDAIKQQAYNNAMAQYGTGSDFQKAAQAVTGLLQGLAGDNLAGALANASSPYLATLIKQQVGEDNKAANAMAHAVLGAVVAELNNQSAAAGGLGAGGGELSAHVIMDTLFPGKKVSDLTENEKQQVSALSQLASGLAGGLTTGDVAGAITGSQAAKNAVENNFLSATKNEKLMKAIDDQKEGKNLLQASQNIVYLTNEDKASNVLLEQYRQGQLNESQQQDLANQLNQYGYELQTVYGFSETEAKAAIQNLVNGGAFVAAYADAKAYNEALSYLKMYGVQSGQAAVGADALVALPGVPGSIIRGTLIAGGSYQTGTGIGQVIEGNYTDGGINIGLGSLAVFGGIAGNKVVEKPTGGIVSPETTIVQESSKVLDKKTHTSIPKVEAELIDKETGKIFKDTNQGNRPDYFLGDKSRPTLINDRIEAKVEKNPSKYLPNGNMASAHAEVGTIQQAFEDGITVGRDMNMKVTKEPVCGYCRGDIAAMADKAGLKSLTVYEESTGKTLYWNPGMKSLKEKK